MIDDERLEAIPVSETVSSLKGMIPKPKRPLSLADMDKGHRQRDTVMTGLDTNRENKAEVTYTFDGKAEESDLFKHVPF